MQPFRYFLIFCISAFMASCALQVAPQGGEKDVKPPKVTKSKPENFSTQFDSKKIQITFDEYIQLKDLNNQLIVSPPLSKNPDAKIKQKTLTVQLDDTLLPNTTYTLNFGNSIVDNNEGNILEGYQYVFSTGEIVDSLKISGIVENALDKKTEKGILVMLYKSEDDSCPLKKRPDYFAKTNDKGEFRITNIAPGKYKIFALKESDGDYIYSGPEEKVAFLDKPVAADSSNVMLRLFSEKPKQRILRCYSEEPGKAVVAFAQPAPGISYRFMSDSIKCNLAFTESSRKKDTLIFWYRNTNLDSLILFFKDNKTIHDTVTIRLFKTDGKTFSKKKNLLSLAPNCQSGGFLDLNKNLEIRFSHPVSESDFSKVTLKEDSVTLADLPISFSDSLKKNLVIRHAWKEKTPYHLFIPPGTFGDILNLKNDTLLRDFQTRQATDYGTLTAKIKITSPGTQYIVMLIDDKETVYRSSVIHGDTILSYDFLDPKAYRLKVVEDLNGNGEWDTGNYLQKIQPEPVAYYPETLTIRSNWDVDVSWNVEMSR
ncbi:MAG: Ig-like domain-containing protein [Bacteroidetes bacterium]|nr:Ig-like domain-containing protein [Bacteroidota bacterium]